MLAVTIFDYWPFLEDMLDQNILTKKALTRNFPWLQIIL